jgi:uncharacterized protein DUF4272
MERAQRSISVLRRYAVPMLEDPLLYTCDDAEVTLRTGPEVARRALVLWAVVLRAEGMPQEVAVALIDGADLWGAVSPKEMQFLRDEHPDPDECQQLVWRLESICVLLWALGHIAELDWPRGMCDVPRLADILKRGEAAPDFVLRATTRDKRAILDAQDLTMRIHWAIRDAWINGGGFLPADLDWSEDYEMAHVAGCPGVGVVEQRHHTLNWLTKFDDAEWDFVDTPT